MPAYPRRAKRPFARRLGEEAGSRPTPVPRCKLLIQNLGTVTTSLPRMRQRAGRGAFISHTEPIWSQYSKHDCTYASARMPPTYRHFFDVGYDRQILRRRFIRQYKKTPKVGIL